MDRNAMISGVFVVLVIMAVILVLAGEDECPVWRRRGGPLIQSGRVSGNTQNSLIDDGTEGPL
ncbi:MAG: hypothetical protein ACLFPX_05680 [Candidatus Omnitrophota bacterium]